MAHRFHDYTVSSAFERFVDAIERAVTELLSTSSGGSQGRVPRAVSVAHSLPFRKDAYALTLLPWRDGDGDGASPWAVDIRSHEVKFHDWFLPQDCIVLEPESYSRRILTSEEYTTVVSAVAVALDNMVRVDGLGLDALTIPVYVPRHDARRDACGGVRKVVVGGCDGGDGGDGRDDGDGRDGRDGGECSGNGTSSKSRVDGGAGIERRRLATQWFECDSVHGRVREASAWVGGLLRRLGILAERLQEVDARRVRMAMEVAVGAADAEENVSLTLAKHGIVCASKRTFHMYRKVQETVDPVEAGGMDGPWDRFMPWAPWVAQDDPIGGVEIDVVEMDRVGECDEEGGFSVPFGDAVAACDSCHIFAMDAGHTTDTGNRSFLPLQVEDVPRKFLRCVDVEMLGDEAMRGFPFQPEMQSGRDGFAARLHACIRWFTLLEEHERIAQKELGVDECLRMDDVLDDGWWTARADELGVGFEPAVAAGDVNDIVENAAASLDRWRERGLSASDVAALHATTIPSSLRGVLQVWQAFTEGASLNWGRHYGDLDDANHSSPFQEMGRMIQGLFRSALLILGTSTSDIVQRQVSVLRAASDPVLRELVGANVKEEDDVSSLETSLYGLSNVLGCVERTAAAAASLRQRLAGFGHGDEEHQVQELIDGVLSNAIRECPNTGYALRQDEQNALIHADRGESVGFDGPVSIEHVIEVHGEPTHGDKMNLLRHRMYVNRLPNEVRIATTILSE